jgi:hypothetical protein
MLLTKQPTHPLVAALRVASQLAWGIGRMATDEVNWVRADQLPGADALSGEPIGAFEIAATQERL